MQTIQHYLSPLGAMTMAGDGEVLSVGHWHWLIFLFCQRTNP